MKLKVCGVKEAAFAQAAARLGVDYLGFIFEPKSPRHVTVDAARAIVAVVKAVAPHPRCVGVFTTQDVAEINAVMAQADLDVVQLHRRATAADVAALQACGREVWTLAGGAPGDGVLFDSSHGDGETVFRRGAYTAILAGKISADNLDEAVALGPDIVDVNSSLEVVKGLKDEGRLQAFIQAWRAHQA